MLQWLRHAFAVDAAPGEPTAAELAVVERLCREIVRRRMSVPALTFLEMSRPLYFLGAQGLHFFAPFLAAITGSDDHVQLARFLERRDSVDLLCRRIQALESESNAARSKPQ